MKMRKKIHLSVLILCAILFQIRALSQENIKESSDLHVRKKRLIDRTPHGNRPVRLEQIPYIVELLKNGKLACGASILTENIILTAAHCMIQPGVTYKIRSDATERNMGKYHIIKNLYIYPHYDAEKYLGDLALLYIFPPINFVRSLNRRINLYNGPLEPNINSSFSGWGCIDIDRRGKPIYPTELRSIVVPIMNLRDCHVFYREKTEVGEQHICTGGVDVQKCSCHGDSGGPLAINGQLAGVMSWSAKQSRNKTYPDVFVNLSYRPYREWITATIQFLAHIRG